MDNLVNSGESCRDPLSETRIRALLDPICESVVPEVVASIPSTNTALKERAASGAAHGCCIIAGSQSGGRGRSTLNQNRGFFSPDTGIYMSLLLRPERFTAQKAERLTTMAAVAVCEAIESLSPEKAVIKWVNDVYMRGRKVCGILTEGAFSTESGFLSYAVVGVGINVYEPERGFPSELEGIAGAAFGSLIKDGRNRLAAEFLNRFMRCYGADGEDGYVEKYRERSFLIGKEVTVLSSAGARRAFVLGVNDECALLVKYVDSGADGKAEVLNSGEVSVRVKSED